MLDFTRPPEGLLDPIARVVHTAREQAPDLAADRVMLVGAGCRDALHAALGHEFETRATRDLDLALALSAWIHRTNMCESRVVTHGCPCVLGESDLLKVDSVQDEGHLVSASLSRHLPGFR